ncbi:16207_t:CDS:2 [Racocetra fulgida]|uniref:16207_t:CDS:1 n=1 Tax=Racocetra fulgida TaxID=60492 RepID=A0A9N8ZYG7_9GLOM|nr:16207_t:CDS:2 [Racocetra fulgida]
MPKDKDKNDSKKPNSNLRDEEIATEFGCDRSTVSKFLKQKKWSEIKKISPNSNALKIIGPKFPQIEKAHQMWVGTAKQQQLTFIGDIIRQKALHFATLLNVSKEEFKASQGWLAWFKARIGFQNHRIYSKARSAPIELLPQFREKLKNILDTYKPQNIFNTDECGLYYHMKTQIFEIIIAQREAQEIINLTDNPDIQQLAQEYLDNDKFIAIEEVMNDNRIIELINNPDTDDNDNNLPNSFIKETDEAYLYDFLLRTYRASNKLMKQSTLEDFLANDNSKN